MIIKEVSALGYPEDYLTMCLEKEEKNYATTAYYLLGDLQTGPKS